MGAVEFWLSVLILHLNSPHHAMQVPPNRHPQLERTQHLIWPPQALEAPVPLIRWWFPSQGLWDTQTFSMRV